MVAVVLLGAAMILWGRRWRRRVGRLGMLGGGRAWGSHVRRREARRFDARRDGVRFGMDLRALRLGLALDLRPLRLLGLLHACLRLALALPLLGLLSLLQFTPLRLLGLP